MAKLSISRAWDETRDVLARDGRLIATVALALLVLPSIVSGLISPSSGAGREPPSAVAAIVLFVVSLIGLVGQLAIIRLALGPSTSVGEAIGHGARRLLPYFLAVFLFVLAIALPMVIVLVAMGVEFGPEMTQLPPAVSMVILVFAIAALYCAVRLLLTSAVASAQPGGPLAILRRSWELSSGNWWRLFAFLMLFVIATIVAVGGVTLIVGTLIGVVGGQPEPLSLGALLLAIVEAVLTAIATTVFVVMLARIYAQAAGRTQDVAELFR